MADEPQVIRGINWREVFPFTHIFRAFRIAIHPSKLMLGVLAILLLYGGGRVLDLFWASGSRAVPNEIQTCYLRENRNLSFNECRDAERKQVVDFVTDYLFDKDKAKDKPLWKDKDEAARDVKAKPGKAYSDYVDARKKDLDDALKAADKKYDEDKKSDNKDVKEKAGETRDRTYRAAYEAAYADLTRAKAIKGVGLFDEFLHYQAAQINNVWQGVLGGNWLGGFAGSSEPTDGVIRSTIKFFIVAPGWALQHHWFYFILYGVWFLIIWSVFGGAIARIAAVQVADEGRKLSMRQGLSFSVSKFLSFISAPLIPLLIIVIIGVLTALGGFVLFGIPGWSHIGSVIGGILFFLALAGGFVMTLVLIGAIGGFNLMYPTVAVEGSDSFDAISRSFSYVYARPWRMLWYTLWAIAYGALTYLFVRFFIYAMLVLTHKSAGLFAGWADARNTVDAFTVMWPAPRWESLIYEVNHSALSFGHSLGAFFIAVWVYLTIALLGAFAISMYISASTIIYYLMRREVDATEMDDVYLEQPEDEFAEPAPAAAAEGAAPAGEGAAAPAAGPAAPDQTTPTQPATEAPSPTPPPGEPPANPPTP